MFDGQIFRWLTICLGAESNEAKAAQLSSLQYLDWVRILELAAQFGLLAHLYDRLKRLPATLAIPGEIMERPRKAFLENAGRNTRLIHDLGRILPALREAGIRVIALKGAHLAGSVYENIAVRRIGSDIDLLVPDTDFVRASATLRSLGYQSGEGDGVEENWQAKKNVTLLGPPGAVPVELHWTIELPSEPIKVDLSGLWSRARLLSVANCDVLGFAYEDLLLHLCLEATYHHGGWFKMGLRPFCDIVAIIQRAGADMDWDQVRDRSREWRASHLVHLALWLAREWLAAPVPETVLASLKPNAFDKSLGDLAGELVFFQSFVPGAVQSVSWSAAQLGGPKSFKDKVRIAFEAAFPPRSRIASMYGIRADSPQAYACYLPHLARLVRRNAPMGWRILFGKKEAAAHVQGINTLIELKEQMRLKLTAEANPLNIC